MKKLFPHCFPLVVTALLALAFSGCSRESQKARYLEKADRSFSSGNYEEAEINYKNLLQIENLNPHAIGRLGIIYTEQGRIGPAIAFVVKGRELQPDNLEIRLKYAQLSLAVGALKDARSEAEYILQRRPQDPEAPLLLAATIIRPQDISGVQARLNGLDATARAQAPVLTALGLIELRQGHLKEAESLFTQALAINAKFAATHAAFGALHSVQKDLPKAEQAFKNAAEASPPRSPLRLQYARFKIQSGDPAAGKRYLESLTQATPDFLSAWTLLAELALAEKRYADCAGNIEKVTSHDALNLEALFLRGRLQMAQGNPAKAVEEYERLLAAYPRASQVHYQLGLAHLAANDLGKAAASLRQALALAPAMADANLALASINLRTGDPIAAIAQLKPLVKQRPENAQARLLLAAAHRAQKNFADALAIYDQLEKDFPGNAQTSLLRGLTLLQQNQPADARRAFTEALERAPGLMPALERLVSLDVQDKQVEAAIQRVDAELVRDPDSAGAHVLRAKLCMLKPDTERAESEFKKAIALQPEATEAYYLLAQLYLGAGEVPKALANLQSIVSRNPKDLGALMLIGIIHEQQKDYAGARDAYEKALAINPKAINALNNVAYLYSERFNEQDKAQTAAQKARELQPQEPHIADTLGWILFKKGQYRRALSLLEESAVKLTDSPEVHYHLGSARYMLGQDGPARLALQHALDLSKDFPGFSEAQQRLALLEIDVRTPNAGARALLEKTLEVRPGDPVALARLAALQELDGATDKAIATLQKAAEANPGVVTPLINLARRYAVGNNTAKALEMAKAARKAEPDNPETARVLGGIAYQAGDYPWSASLLQDAARKLPGDPELLFEEGKALYSIGRVAEALESMRAALDPTATIAASGLYEQAPGVFAHAEEARRFIEMVELPTKPTPTAIARAEQLLTTEPDYVPALMALGAVHEQGADPASAEKLYGKAVARFPDFTPAKVRLAVLGAGKPDFDEKALGLAQQARTVYPNDAELAKALGILVYRKGGDAKRAVSLLSESATTRANDAELLYFLGMAQFQTKDTAAGRQTLQKALNAGLSPALANEARKVLSSPK